MKRTFEALEKINYWGNKSDITLGFIREHYLNEISKASENKLIKVIVGQRRSGKSYIIRQYIQHLISDKKVNPVNIFYLNKELYDFEGIKNASDLDKLINYYKQQLKLKGKVYVFIDEIQNIKDWEKIIVSLAQHTLEDYEIYVTGSNSNLLSGELATLLSGRYIVLEVFPFSFTEYLGIYQLQNNKENFLKYLQSSGLPEIYNIQSHDIHRHYFQSLKDTILLKDIMFRHKIRDYVLLEDLFLFLLHNVGNLISIPSIIKYFKSKQRKADYSTISAYLSYMHDAFILQQCPKFSLKTKELLSGEKKYYVNDLGFRNFLYPQLITDTGSMLENIVFLHLRRQGYELKVGYNKNFEVDFIASKGETKKYIQVTYLLSSEDTIQREFRSLESINDNFPKCLLSMDDIKIKHPKGFEHLHVWEFLKSSD
jgi:hypothetical protein